jgi:hypothetical protein
MGTWSAANDTRAGKWRASAGAGTAGTAESERNDRAISRILKTIAVE